MSRKDVSKVASLLWRRVATIGLDAIVEFCKARKTGEAEVAVKIACGWRHDLVRCSLEELKRVFWMMTFVCR